MRIFWVRWWTVMNCLVHCLVKWPNRHHEQLVAIHLMQLHYGPRTQKLTLNFGLMLQQEFWYNLQPPKVFVTPVSKIRFNIILRYTSMCSKESLHIYFSNQVFNAFDLYPIKMFLQCITISKIFRWIKLAHILNTVHRLVLVRETRCFGDWFYFCHQVKA
jgi:hypothetical protein